MTSTYVILDVSASTFREIQTKLEEAGYHHAFTEGDDGQLVIDLHGLALRDEEGDDTPAIDRLDRPDEAALRPTRRS